MEWLLRFNYLAATTSISSVVNCNAQLFRLFSVLCQIHKRVGEIQENVLKQNKLLKPSMIALPTLHLTLFVMHLSDDIQLSRYMNVYIHS